MVQARRIRVAVRLPGPERRMVARTPVTRGADGAQIGPGGTLGQVKDPTGGSTPRGLARNAKMQEIGCPFAHTLA